MADCKSAVGDHLARNLSCVHDFDLSHFSVICRARDGLNVLHFLEVLCIVKLETELCAHMEFVCTLHVRTLPSVRQVPTELVNISHLPHA